MPSSPAPCYQPDQLFQAKVRLNNKAFDSICEKHTIRRVASVPNTTEYFKQKTESMSTPASPSPSYSLQKHKVQVGPADFDKVRLLGKGDVGKVYLVKHKSTEKLYALKGNTTLSFFTPLLMVFYSVVKKRNDQAKQDQAGYGRTSHFVYRKSSFHCSLVPLFSKRRSSLFLHGILCRR